MEKYELMKDIGSGNFGVARLMRNKNTKELVAMKYIERGHKVFPFFLFYFFFKFLIKPILLLACMYLLMNESFDFWFLILSYVFVYLIFGITVFQIDANVAREIINHKQLRHPNIIRFKEVIFCFLFCGFGFCLVEFLFVKIVLIWESMLHICLFFKILIGAFEFCRWFWLQHTWQLWWSMQLGVSSLSEFVMLEGSVKMKYDLY